MKTTPVTAASFLLGLLLAACSGPSRMSRIDANRAAYETWPIEVKEAILAGKAIPGMTPAQVRVALGQPSEIVPQTSDKGVAQEVWVYRTESADSGGSSGPQISLGGSVGGVNVTSGGGGGGGSYPTTAPEDQGEVLFENGLVVRSNVLPDTP